MIVVDTSVIVAIMRHEDDAAIWIDILDRTKKGYISVVSYVEANMVIVGRRMGAEPEAVQSILTALRIEIAPVTVDQGVAAIASFMTYGKGRHPAQLNLADCFAYALAKTKGLPLLFKGGDFAKTDIASARGAY